MNAGVDSLKTASTKLVHKADILLGNKIADAVTKSKKYIIVEEIIIRQKKEIKY